MSQIFVQEDQHHYIVNTSYAERARAQGINGRLWDGLRRVWVYEKNEETYNSLVTEFKDDAKVFQISRPGPQYSENKVSIEDDTSVLEEYESFESRLSFHDSDLIEKTVPAVADRLAGESKKTWALLA